MWPNPQETADSVTFIEEILNGKIFIFCAEYFTQSHNKMRLNKIFQT